MWRPSACRPHPEEGDFTRARVFRSLYSILRDKFHSHEDDITCHLKKKNRELDNPRRCFPFDMITSELKKSHTFIAV